MGRPTLIDVARRKADDRLVPLLDECALAIPEMRLSAITLGAGQTAFTTLVRTKRNPAPFRKVNTGAAYDKSGYQNRTFKCATITPRFEVDEALAAQHPRGLAGGMYEEGVNVLNDDFVHLAAAFWYGQSYHLDAFPGVRDIIPTSQAIDAANGASVTGLAVTECYLLLAGDLGSDWVWGDNGKFSMGDPRRETLRDASNNPFAGWVMDGLGYVGAMHRSPRTMVMIKNICDTFPLTGTLLQKAWGMFPAGRTPNSIFTTMLGQQTLTNSRRTELITDPPLATNWNGIDIGVSEAIVTGDSGAVPDFSAEVSVKFKGE